MLGKAPSRLLNTVSRKSAGQYYRQTHVTDAILWDWDRVEYFKCCDQNIGVGAQSTLGGHDIFARKICMKN